MSAITSAVSPVEAALEDLEPLRLARILEEDGELITSEAIATTLALPEGSGQSGPDELRTPITISVASARGCWGQ